MLTVPASLPAVAFPQAKSTAAGDVRASSAKAGTTAKTGEFSQLLDSLGTVVSSSPRAPVTLIDAGTPVPDAAAPTVQTFSFAMPSKAGNPGGKILPEPAICAMDESATAGEATVLETNACSDDASDVDACDGLSAGGLDDQALPISSDVAALMAGMTPGNQPMRPSRQDRAAVEGFIGTLRLPDRFASKSQADRALVQAFAALPTVKDQTATLATGAARPKGPSVEAQSTTAAILAAAHPFASEVDAAHSSLAQISNVAKTGADNPEHPLTVSRSADEPAQDATVIAPAPPVSTTLASFGVVADAPTVAVADPATGQTDFAEIVSRLAQARETSGASVVRASVAHPEFGPVSVEIRPDKDGLAVTLANSDPAFGDVANMAARSVVQASAAASLAQDRQQDQPSFASDQSSSSAGQHLSGSGGGRADQQPRDGASYPPHEATRHGAAAVVHTPDKEISERPGKDDPYQTSGIYA